MHPSGRCLAGGSAAAVLTGPAQAAAAAELPASCALPAGRNAGGAAVPQHGPPAHRDDVCTRSGHRGARCNGLQRGGVRLVAARSLSVRCVPPVLSALSHHPRTVPCCGPLRRCRSGRMAAACTSSCGYCKSFATGAACCRRLTRACCSCRGAGPTLRPSSPRHRRLPVRGRFACCQGCLLGSARQGRFATASVQPTPAAPTQEAPPAALHPLAGANSASNALLVFGVRRRSNLPARPRRFARRPQPLQCADYKLREGRTAVAGEGGVATAGTAGRGLWFIGTMRPARCSRPAAGVRASALQLLGLVPQTKGALVLQPRAPSTSLCKI